MMEALWGEKEALYVQLWVGRVRMESVRSGDHFCDFI